MAWGKGSWGLTGKWGGSSVTPPPPGPGGDGLTWGSGQPWGGDQTWGGATAPPGAMQPVGARYIWYALDAHYARKAEIGAECVIETNLVMNDVGTITIAAPYDDACVPVLLQPGARWELSYGDNAVADTIASGPIDNSFERDWGAPSGGQQTDMITFAGETDLTWADRRLAHPDPAHADVDTYTQASDDRSGNVDKVIGDYVFYNLGAGAIPIRYGINNPGAAPTPLLLEPGYGTLAGPLAAPAKARMQNLLQFLQGLAAIVDTIVFDAHVIGPSPSPTNRQPYFVMRIPDDKSADVRFSHDFGNVASFKYGATRPAGTAFYVGDQSSSGAARTFVRRYSGSQIPIWGRIEGLVSGSGTTGQQQQQGDAAIQQNKAKSEVQVVPVQGTANAVFLDDYKLGDLVSVVVDGTVIIDMVQAVKITRDANGVVVAPSVGGGIFDETQARTTAARNLAARIRDQERI